MINQKTYLWARVIVAAGLGIVISQAVIFGNLILALVSMIVAWIILFYLRSKVKAVLADERDYEIGGTAARWAIQIFSIVAVVFILIFYTQRGVNPAYEAIAVTLSYSVCFLMVLYSLIFKFYNRLLWLKGKNWLILIGTVLLLMIIVFGLRLLSGEDDWICQNGQWVKHGQPDWPAPTIDCKK
ncbi:MAG: DUF2178 domain-containing protein [Patescibacteria group bacterium]